MNISVERDVAIRLDSLLTRVGGRVLHDHIDLQVFRGEVLGVVGSSGSGKSVLLRSIIGLQRPAGGRIEVLGEDVGTSAAMISYGCRCVGAYLFRMARCSATRPWLRMSRCRFGSTRICPND